MSANPGSVTASAHFGRQRILALDAIRQIAALIVLVHHFFVIFETEPPPLLQTGLFDAKAAVTLFFVLSGYVLALSLHREPAIFSSYVNFGIRRVLRLYPLHISATLLCFFVLSWIKQNGGLSQQLENPIGFLQTGDLDLKQWLLQVSLILPGMEANFANPPVWTLMTEAKVSIIFPFLAWAVFGLGWRSAFIIVGTLMLGSDWLDRNLAGTFSLLGLFGLGALVARINQQSLSHLRAVHWSIWLAASLALYSMVGLRNQMPNIWIAFYLGGIGASGLIIAVTCWSFLTGAFTAVQRFLRFDISYGLYILHYPIMLWIRQLSGGAASSLPAPALFAICLVLTILVSVILTIVVERPAIALGRRLTSNRPGTSGSPTGEAS